MAPDNSSTSTSTSTGTNDPLGIESIEGVESIENLSTVTTDTVRQALGGNDALAESTIALALKMAKSDIESVADPTVDDHQRLVAIVRVAAYEAFDSAPATVQKEAADASRRWNTDEFADRLKERAESALEGVARANAPRLVTLGGRSRTTGGRPRSRRQGRGHGRERFGR